jgi:hypothetical protein
MVTEERVTRALSDNNELKIEIARRDLLHELAAAALADQMTGLVARLVQAGILPSGTQALRDSLLHDE